MAESYTDEEIAKLSGGLCARTLATCRRLLAERDAARADALANLKGIMTALNERDEAQRVAKVLAKLACIDVQMDERERAIQQTALAYPDRGGK